MIVAVYRRTSRPRFTLVLLVLTSVTVLTLDQRGQGSTFIDSVKGAARDVFAPVQDATDTVISPVSDFFGGVADHGQLEAENERLRQQLEEARAQALQAEDAQRERQALLDQQDLEFAGDIPAVAARVVSNAASNFELTVEIDRGTGAGIARDMPVVAGAGLVGRVVHVSQRRATVLLLTDRSSHVGIRLTSSGDVGVANGQGYGDPMSVDLIDQATEVEPREVVVTSGLQQSVYPPGIPVGRIRSAKSQPGALQQDVTLDPVVDLRRLAFVKVLLWSQGSEPESP